MGLYIPAWDVFSISMVLLGSILAVSAIATESNPQLRTAYSKFAKIEADIPSRIAMLGIYTPTLVVSLIALLIFGANSGWSRYAIYAFLHLVHYGKRYLEVLFVHVYSGKTDFNTAVTISGSYATTTLLDLIMISRVPADVYASQSAHTWLTAGLVLFAIGELGNLYHHILLRFLRTRSESLGTTYQVPKGGLFRYVACPHYFCEQIAFLGMMVVSQNIVSVFLKLFPFFYLTVRAKATNDWYKQTTKRYPSNRKNLVPFIW